GSSEIGFTIVSMIVSLVAVFIPVLFMGGILGRLFREFAITISAAILVSGVVALTLTPMLCSRLLKERGIRESAHHETEAVKNPKAWWRFSENAYNFILNGYRWTLERVLAHSLVTIVVMVLLAGATIYLFRIVPKGFIPG